MPWRNTAHDAMVERMIQGMSSLGAGLGTLGHRYLTEEGRADAAAKIARDKLAADEAARQNAAGAAMHPLQMGAIDTYGQGPYEAQRREALGLPPINTFDEVTGGPSAPSPGGPAWAAAGPSASPMEALAAAGPPPAGPSGPPPMGFLDVLGLGRGGPPGAAAGGMPPALPPGIGPGAAPPPATPAAPGPVPTPDDAGDFRGLPKPVSPFPEVGSMGKAPVPATRSLPGYGDFSHSKRRTQQELASAKMFAFTGNNPALASGLSEQGLRLAMLEDPDAVARDNSKIARAVAAGDKNALSALDTKLETRAGSESLSGLIEKLAGESRKSAAEIAKEREKAGGKESIERLKNQGRLDVETRRNEGRMAVAKVTSERVLEAAKIRANAQGQKPALTANEYVGNVFRHLNELESEAKAAYADSFNKEFGEPNEGYTPEDVANLRTAWKAAQRAVNEFDQNAVVTEWQQKQGKAAPAEAAPAPSGAAPSKTPKAAPAAPAGKPTKEQLIDQAADAEPWSPEEQAILQQLNDLYGGEKTKALVVDQAPEKPLEGGQVDAEAGRKAVGRAHYRQREIEQNGLTDEARRAHYQSIEAGEGQYGSLTPEQREHAIRRAYEEDEAEIQSILKRYSGAPDPEAAKKKQAAEAAFKATQEKTSAEEVARKKRLGGAADFIGR